MVLIVTSLVLVALAAPVLLLHYLTRLPEAPSCPGCRRVTSEVDRVRDVWGADGLWTLLSATRTRRCTACGWEGRMRWRWAVERAGSEDGRA